MKELRIAVEDSHELISVWLNTSSDVSFSTVMIRAPKGMPSYFDDRYVPQGVNLITRLDFVADGILHFDLDVIYSCVDLKAWASVPSEASGVLLGAFQLSGVSCVTDFSFNQPLDAFVNCQCPETGFTSASHCPRTRSWLCSQAEHILISPSQVCDGVGQCSSSVDEKACTVRLRVDSATIGDVPSCFQSFTLGVDAGGVSASADGSCYMKHGVVRSNRSLEGHGGGETFRAFLNDQGCGYVLFRFKHSNGTGQFQAHRAQLEGFLVSQPINNCPQVSVEDFQAAYGAYHASAQAFTTLPPTSPMPTAALEASAKDTGNVTMVIVVLLGLLIAIAVGLLILRKQRHKSRPRDVLQQLVAEAQQQLHAACNLKTAASHPNLPVLQK